jgi:hypothetical protein
MDFFSSGPQITLIDWTQACRPDQAGLIANSTYARLDPPTDIQFVLLTSLFDDPDNAARVLYAQYWQRKLKDNKDVSFPDSLVTEIADETERFSFAYLKEALYGSLITSGCHTPR